MTTNQMERAKAATRDALLLENATLDCSWNLYVQQSGSRGGHISISDLLQGRFNIYVAAGGICLEYRSIEEVIEAGWSVRLDNEDEPTDSDQSFGATCP